MKGIIWRIIYVFKSVYRSLTSTVFDWGSMLFFLCVGSLRNRFFGEYFLIHRFFKKFPIGSITKTETEICIVIRGLTFYAPLHGLEQGDFFDIIVPYLVSIEKEGDVFEKYYHINFGDFFDGPYITSLEMLRNGDYVIDAGCNIGLFSVVAAKLTGPSGKVFAFDPIAEVLSYAQRNVHVNDLQNVQFISQALGEKDTDISMSIDLADSFEGSSKYIRRSGVTRTIIQTKLDSFVSSYAIERIDFIKADIEGAENDLLLGSKSVIQKFLPTLAIRTYHFPHDYNVISSTIHDLVPTYTVSSFRKNTIYAHI
ncbi:MAG: FkbM family methyltransferase [Candidatus Paceibacterota bacterium]